MKKFHPYFLGWNGSYTAVWLEGCSDSISCLVERIGWQIFWPNLPICLALSRRLPGRGPTRLPCSISPPLKLRQRASLTPTALEVPPPHSVRWRQCRTARSPGFAGSRHPESWVNIRSKGLLHSCALQPNMGCNSSIPVGSPTKHHLCTS